MSIAAGHTAEGSAFFETDRDRGTAGKIYDFLNPGSACAFRDHDAVKRAARF